MAALKLAARRCAWCSRAQQMFSFGHRPETLQTLKLAADADGTAAVRRARGGLRDLAQRRLRREHRQLVGAALHAATNVRLAHQRGRARPLHADRHARARRGAGRLCARKSRWTSWRYAVGMDPLALRLQQLHRDATRQAASRSRARRCATAMRVARSASAGRGATRSRARCATAATLVGWGMATGVWDAMQMLARAHAVLRVDGMLEVASATTDIGTGTVHGDDADRGDDPGPAARAR